MVGVTDVSSRGRGCLPWGQVMTGQHWSGLFSSLQSKPIGLLYGQTWARKIRFWSVLN